MQISLYAPSHPNPKVFPPLNRSSCAFFSAFSLHTYRNFLYPVLIFRKYSNLFENELLKPVFLSKCTKLYQIVFLIMPLCFTINIIFNLTVAFIFLSVIRRAGKENCVKGMLGVLASYYYCPQIQENTQLQTNNWQNNNIERRRLPSLLCKYNSVFFSLWPIFLYPVPVYGYIPPPRPLLAN